MLKTFRIGGIHPADNKLSAGSAIQTLPLPSEVKIPVSQHIGAPAQPIVAVGDQVKVGQLIAQAGGFVSANVHSPVSGKVKKIEDIIDGNGYKKQAIIIAVEGDEWDESIDRSPGIKRDISLSPAEISKKISEMGLVGMGGATFPTHVKLAVPEGKKCEALVINGVECEPYLTSDYRRMVEQPEKLVEGMRIILQLFPQAKMNC